jgi:hypothetical protein
VFFVPSPLIWQGVKGLFTSVKAKLKKEVGRRNKNSFGVLEGVVMASGE